MNFESVRLVTRMTPHKPYPTNVSDEEWTFAAPYLTLMTEQAPQRRHDLRAMFNALRWMARAGAPWRLVASAGAAHHRQRNYG